MSSRSDGTLATRDVHFDRRGAVAHILIDRPGVMNALAPATMEKLADAFLRAERDPEVRVIVIRGAGERAFSAGVDLGVTREALVHPMKRETRNLHEIILETEKPTIAAINGVCIGAGCEIALACDLRIAVKEARFGQTEAKVGMGGNFAAVLLPQLLPRALAMELLYTGRLFSADEAFGWGLLNRVVDASELDSAAADMANSIAANAPLTVHKLKATLIRSHGLPLSAALRLDAGPDPYNSQDRMEGALAFKEKRAPRFRGI
ncbi:enoyl-CoA hydratase/isomerase family protein [Verminephrobacter eiseniae]|uniref:enoyl-CoA hydratase/isomerase family protein n=1 Tax=Verminephrobacter eiseniae TaxID=364317 RepID=UPI0022376C63|nr:enoyl-CoA hydratase/isomerase family protein [Verminephrobacter eiseniae]MCW5286584.1 enoyl-CoA hydratase/isomerase family protein [Verminephrobacter eiseniae]MCW5304883.1 enoyl-CoA hydratase/isomerase family protein [Verminephrobacter eiseniae]MCW8178285.1 enoyl-CoA hydratase/isomerase family protein [Verminephrobacter eiseniae]MCW8190053.1 enoyl-CoA hydratase/isomerase family protein [Verminephrobacter eiseniae]